MATAVSTTGKYELFKWGWTTKVAWAKLYTDADVLVDTQSMTLTYSSGTGKATPSADIVFSVAASTEDVAYVTIGYTDGGSTIHELYTKDLSSLYDFSTAGTLTVDSWEFTLGGTALTSGGRDLLWISGWESIDTAKVYTSANALLATETIEVAANVSGYIAPTADIVFDITSGVAYYISLGYMVESSFVECYKRILDTSYTFSTPGTLTIDSWSITL